jgi:hypothetical protein
MSTLDTTIPIPDGVLDAQRVTKPTAKPRHRPKVPDNLSKDDMMAVLIDVLHGIWGIELPEDTTDKSLKRNLIKAIMAQVGEEATAAVA